MKKGLWIAVILLTLVGTALYAQNSSGDLQVKDVVGNVQWESSPGVWEKLEPGMALDLTISVNTGLNSSLIIKRGDELITIRAMKRGMLQDLITTQTSSRGGIRLGGRLAESDINTDADQGRSNISTASTRASDATEDLEWLDEDLDD
jgi:hypothetical protein